MLGVQLSGLYASLWEMTHDYQRAKKMICNILILLLVAMKPYEDYIL